MKVIKDAPPDSDWWFASFLIVIALFVVILAGLVGFAIGVVVTSR